MCLGLECRQLGSPNPQSRRKAAEDTPVLLLHAELLAFGWERCLHLLRPQKTFVLIVVCEEREKKACFFPDRDVISSTEIHLLG